VLRAQVFARCNDGRVALAFVVAGLPFVKFRNKGGRWNVRWVTGGSEALTPAASAAIAEATRFPKPSANIVCVRLAISDLGPSQGLSSRGVPKPKLLPPNSTFPAPWSGKPA